MYEARLMKICKIQRPSVNVYHRDCFKLVMGLREQKEAKSKFELMCTVSTKYKTVQQRFYAELVFDEIKKHI